MALQNVIAVDKGKIIGATEKIATANTPGIVQPDGETINVDGNGVISSGKHYTGVLSNITGSLYKQGNICHLYIHTPTTRITYNEPYNCGKIPLECIPVDDNMITTFTANEREYKLLIIHDDVTIVCLTDSLPSTGIPVLNHTIAYCSI